MAYPLILFDLGDTIMIEETEHKDGDEVTITADLVPGMADLVRGLRDAGVRLGLVADTRSGTYQHVLRRHDLDALFAHVAISEELGIAKPHPEMFLSVVRQAGSAPADALMVGNNYACDIEGAHACGLATLWFRWNDRYPTPRLPRAATYVATTIDEVKAAIDLWLRSHSFRVSRHDPLVDI